VITVAAILAAIVVATMAGGMIGRRIRMGRERRAEGGSAGPPRSAAESRVMVTRAPDPRPAAADASVAAQGSAAVPHDEGPQSVGPMTHGPMPGDPGVRPIRERLAMPEVVGTSAFARRLAAGPPPMARRHPSSQSPVAADRAGMPVMSAGGRAGTSAMDATAAATVSGSPKAPSQRRDRRRDAGLVLGIAGTVLVAVAIALGWPGTQPSGAVLDASGTPDVSRPSVGAAGSSAASDQPVSEGESPQPSAEDPQATPRVRGRTIVGLDQAAGDQPVGPVQLTVPTPSPGGAATPLPTGARGSTATPEPGASPTTTPTPGATPAATATPVPTPTPGSTPRPTPTATTPPAPTPTTAPTPTPAPTPTATTPALDVAFTFSVNGLRVTFSNKTKGADSYAWSFGDGGTATTRNPTHAYAVAGSYDVTLTATANGASASVTHTVNVGG
jgi:hypothetical protein